MNGCGLLPGVTFPDAERRLRLWMDVNGWSCTRIAEEYGCHKSAPGKFLFGDADGLPPKLRTWLVERGFPAELLPVATSGVPGRKRREDYGVF